MGTGTGSYIKPCPCTSPQPDRAPAKRLASACRSRCNWSAEPCRTWAYSSTATEHSSYSLCTWTLVILEEAVVCCQVLRHKPLLPSNITNNLIAFASACCFTLQKRKSRERHWKITAAFISPHAKTKYVIQIRLHPVIALARPD